MVADTGATGGPGRVRPLNRPRPLPMEVDGDGLPIAVWLSDRRYAVEAVLERWRIDDEWWRQRPVSRLYYRLALADGRTVTVYRDLVSTKWCRQAY